MWLTRRRYMHIRLGELELQRVPILNPDAPSPFDRFKQLYVCCRYYLTVATHSVSYLDMAAWFDRRRFDFLAVMHSATGVVPRIPKFEISHPLVFCHMNLLMRNFISRRLWHVDWANAGPFPPWLDYAHMVLWADAAREDILYEVYGWGLSGIFQMGYLDKLRRAWDRPSDSFLPPLIISLILG